MSQDELLILVDEHDQPVGRLEKLLVHQQGLLHRAFSIFIFNNKGQLILQQRADEKYHSGGLWTNTCCSHPHYGEEMIDAVQKRLSEEMGIRCKPVFVFSFIYKTKFENGLTEHEYDHVYFGISDDTPQPNHAEVKDWKYISLEYLGEELKKNPKIYSAWLAICFDKVHEYFKQYSTDKSFL
jgi:isopentenyl-diphosphate delta-isomerase